MVKIVSAYQYFIRSFRGFGLWELVLSLLMLAACLVVGQNGVAQALQKKSSVVNPLLPSSDDLTHQVPGGEVPVTADPLVGASEIVFDAQGGGDASPPAVGKRHKNNIKLAQTQPSVLHPAAEEDNNGFTNELVAGGAADGDPSDDANHAFFKRGAATDFFSGEVELKDPSKVSILNSKRKLETEQGSSKSMDRADLRAGLKRSDEGELGSKKKDEADVSLPASPEEVVQRFGDPEQEPRVRPESNAPDSYKGLIAALEVGDDALAYRYARQYVRYQRNLNERVKKLTELSQIALEKDGLVPPSPEDEEDPNYEISKQIADSIEAKSRANQAEMDGRRIQLDQQTQELLRMAQAEEEKNIFSDEAESKQQAELAKSGAAKGLAKTQPKTREQVRAEIAAKVKPDPQGKVLVQYFFRQSDRNNQEMIKTIAEIAWTYRDVPKVGFVAFTIDRRSKEELDNISNASPANLPVRSGSDFAERFGIKRSPAVVIVSATTGEAHILQGKKDRMYLEEFIRRVHGRDL